MENNKQMQKFPTGIFIKGTVVGSRARLFPAKDGKPASLQVQHELALNPGIAVIEEYYDPDKTQGISIKDNQVIDYPHREHLAETEVRAKGCKMIGDKIIFKGISEIIANPF